MTSAQLLFFFLNRFGSIEITFVGDLGRWMGRFQGLVLRPRPIQETCYHFWEREKESSSFDNNTIRLWQCFVLHSRFDDKEPWLFGKHLWVSDDHTQKKTTRAHGTSELYHQSRWGPFVLIFSTSFVARLCPLLPSKRDNSRTQRVVTRH